MTAIEHSGVVGEGFQIVALPVMRAIARFQPYTATYESVLHPLGGRHEGERYGGTYRKVEGR